MKNAILIASLLLLTIQANAQGIYMRFTNGVIKQDFQDYTNHANATKANVSSPAFYGTTIITNGNWINIYYPDGGFLRSNTTTPFDWELHRTNGALSFGTNTVTKFSVSQNGLAIVSSIGIALAASASGTTNVIFINSLGLLVTNDLATFVASIRAGATVPNGLVTNASPVSIVVSNAGVAVTIQSNGVILPAAQPADPNAAITENNAQQLILSSTVDFGPLSPASGVIGMGLDSGTNVIVFHIRSNLVATSTGTNGHYWLDATNGGGGGGSGGSATNIFLVTSNKFVIDTNWIFFDFNNVQTLNLMAETNISVVLTNVYNLTNFHDAQAKFRTWNDTNGTWKIQAMKVANGILKTNGGWNRGTNANQQDYATLERDPTGTNVVITWTATNSQPVQSFTNSLAGGGGGGGGVTWTLVSSVATNALLSAFTTITSPAIDATTGNLILAGVSWYNNTGPLPYDNQNNTFTGLTSYGDASGNHSNQVYYSISPTVASSQTFSLTNTTASLMYCGILVQVWKKTGGTPALDTSTGTNYVSGGGNTTSLATGVATTFGANELVLSAATWNNSGVTATSVSPGFTITDQKTIGDPTASGGIAYTNMAVQATVSPVWNFSGNANALSGSTAGFK